MLVARSPVKTVLGLGANLGDRLATMRSAVARVEDIAPVTARSRVYETAPVGGPEQGPFLNAAIAIAWPDEPQALLEAILRIERGLGRVRDVRWGPRIIDLDILWMAGREVSGPGLVIPHPRLTERAFAVAPLLDVAPEARDPRSGEPYVVPAGQDVRVVEGAF